MQTHIQSQHVIHTVLTISHFSIMPQPQECAHKYTFIWTSTDTHTRMHTHKRIRNNPNPTSYKQFPHLPTLPQAILCQKKNTSPCSVADSECKASNSLKMRKFSWGYWISPSSLCSVVSWTYRPQCWIDQTLHKRDKGCQVNFEEEFSLLYPECCFWFICSCARRTKALLLQHERDGGWYYMFSA